MLLFILIDIIYTNCEYNNKGINNLNLTSSWKYSDDTKMHLATCLGLIHSSELDLDFYQHLALEYKLSMKDMSGRCPGLTCITFCE